MLVDKRVLGTEICETGSVAGGSALADQSLSVVISQKLSEFCKSINVIGDTFFVCSRIVLIQVFVDIQDQAISISIRVCDRHKSTGRAA